MNTLDPAHAPIRVVELELAPPARVRSVGQPSENAPSPQYALALVRLHGRPLGLVHAHVPDLRGVLDVLLEAAHTQLGQAIRDHLAEDGIADLAADPDVFPARCRHSTLNALTNAPAVSVVVATCGRPEQLDRALASLSRLVYPNYEVIVVDNAPADGRTEQLIREKYAASVTYVREPVRGVASAHNRGLRTAQGAIIAITDDDVIVDPDWLAAVAEGFAAGPDVGCVNGLIVPAQLETPAQIMLESTGDFVKGFTRRHYRSGRTDKDDPLYPFAAGRFGSGANMAFSVAALRELGGFDPATGTGSLARGGHDLLAFFQIAAAGHDIVYTPDAVVWHHHKRTEQALRDQAYGYGVGLGAYLTAALLREPGMVPAFLRRVPRGVVYAFEQSRCGVDRGAAGGAGTGPGRLAALRRRGAFYGPFAYFKSRRFIRNNAIRGSGARS
jgi:GT2 family glycosyltransferase